MWSVDLQSGDADQPLRHWALAVCSVGQVARLRSGGVGGAARPNSGSASAGFSIEPLATGAADAASPCGRGVMHIGLGLGVAGGRAPGGPAAVPASDFVDSGCSGDGGSHVGAAIFQFDSAFDCRWTCTDSGEWFVCNHRWPRGDDGPIPGHLAGVCPGADGCARLRRPQFCVGDGLRVVGALERGHFATAAIPCPCGLDRLVFAPQASPSLLAPACAGAAGTSAQCCGDGCVCGLRNPFSRLGGGTLGCRPNGCCARFGLCRLWRGVPALALLVRPALANERPRAATGAGPHFGWSWSAGAGGRGWSVVRWCVWVQLGVAGGHCRPASGLGHPGAAGGSGACVCAALWLRVEQPAAGFLGRVVAR